MFIHTLYYVIVLFILTAVQPKMISIRSIRSLGLVGRRWGGGRDGGRVEGGVEGGEKRRGDAVTDNLCHSPAAALGVSLGLNL